MFWSCFTCIRIRRLKIIVYFIKLVSFSKTILSSDTSAVKQKHIPLQLSGKIVWEANFKRKFSSMIQMIAQVCRQHSAQSNYFMLRCSLSRPLSPFCARRTTRLSPTAHRGALVACVDSGGCSSISYPVVTRGSKLGKLMQQSLHRYNYHSPSCCVGGSNYVADN